MASVTTLVVADAYVDTMELRTMLEGPGRAALFACSASDAIAKTAGYLPAFILLICGTAEMEGRGLLAELLIWHPGAAVILMSQAPRLEDVVEAMKLGAADFWEWPPDPNKLRQAMQGQRSAAPQTSPGQGPAIGPA